MFNAEKPSLDQLPTTAQLVRSTAIAAASAAAILALVVLPAEYGIDPTGIGDVLGLTEMGEIKRELAAEAEADRQMGAGAEEQSSLLAPVWDGLTGLLVGAAQAQAAPEAPAGDWRDEVSFTLEPGGTAEIKLVMEEGASAEYNMTVDGGRVNFDLHGHGGGESVTYEKGRGSTGAEGAILAAFAGEHGWFWRNRDDEPSTVTLQVRGEYAEFKRIE